MTRSVFQLCREDSVDMYICDDNIRYGQKLRIEANQYLFRKRLQLNSLKHSPTTCSPLSQKQLAYLSAARPCADGVWVIDHVDPNVRFEMQGEPVRAGEPVLIRHV